MNARHRTARGPIYDVQMATLKQLQRLAPGAPRGEMRWGLCETCLLRGNRRGKRNKIWINDRLSQWELVSTMIHELLHAEFPQYEEWAVRKLERSLMAMIHRGFSWNNAMAKKRARKKR